MTIEFFVRGIPKTKGSTSSYYVPKQRRVVTTNACKGNKHWAQAVSVVARKHRPPTPWTGAVSLMLTFILPMSRRVKTMESRGEPIPHIRRPDLSKLLRSVEDAMTGIIYRDDKQIISEVLQKFYGETPGVNVRVWRSGE